MSNPAFRIAALYVWMVSASLMVSAQSLPPQRQTPLPVAPINWATVNNEITRELRTVELGTLARKALTAPPPASADAWLRRLAVLVRADYPDDVQRMLRARPRFLAPDQDWGLQQLVSESSGYDNILLARRLSELFPEQTYEYNWFEKWAKSTEIKDVDTWLARQGQAGEGRWFRQRLKFRARLGTEKELLAPLEAQVRAHPDRMETVEAYLRAVAATEQPQDTAWLAAVVRPKLAVEAFVLGGYLGNRAAAIPVFERSLSMPFTRQDAEWYADYARRMHFAYLGPNFRLTETQLRQWTKSHLLSLYQKQGQPAKAQKLLEEITAQHPGGVPNTPLAYQAGEVQANSGARVVEQRIQKAEAEQQDTPEYWLSRALYYSGRKEDKPAVEAFEKGLALVPMDAEGRLTMRWRVLSEYARHLWLRNVENPVDAYRFMRKELDSTPLKGDHARALIMELLHYDNRDASRLIAPNDERFWAFLAAQMDWKVHGRSLLEHLYRNAPAEQREATLQRAETMAKESPTAERSRALGTLMISLGKYERAAFWIEDVLSRLKDKEELPSARYDLWQAYRARNNWRGMARLLSQMEQDQTLHWQSTTALRELAVAAAESGAKEEAITFFQKWANQDRRPVPGELYPLPADGLLPALRAYYARIAQTEPKSATPTRVLKMIGAE